ncbi:MAG: M48 family metalloprotease [Gammaproteobacteria bacterium]|nr:M48 family metalloprotease [Gammaproteobacteria bacterium]
MMGKSFFQTLKANVPFVDTLEVNDYLNTLGQKLVSQSDQPDQNFKFFILKIPSINAFAGPDAHIGIHSGLILAADNESELAGVLAHEISHVTQRHLARAQSEGTSPAAIFAAILAGILVGAENPDAGAAIIYGGTAAMMQSQINFTRHNEYEADRVGISILRKANINPDGMAQFFETLLENTDSNNILSQMEYLRTHPLSTTRIAEARHRISDKDANLPKDSLNFQLTKAQVVISASTSLPAQIKKLKSLPADKKNIVTRYMLAIALTADDKASEAIEILLPLIEEHEHPWFQLALAKAYIQANKQEQALEILRVLEKLYPNYLPVTIYYVEMLNHFGQYDEAIKLLKRLLQYQKQTIIYKTLAQSYFSNGQTGAALEATSYQYELDGYIKLAAQQIENALKQPDLNPITIQRLESRKKELTSQMSQK